MCFGKGSEVTACRICGNLEGNTPYVARELHLGLGEEFEYFECARCGCLQIHEIPQDLSKYYPDNYYSYKAAVPTVDFSSQRVGRDKQRLVLRLLTKYHFGNKSAFGNWLAKRSSLSRDYPLWVRQQRLDLKLHSSSSILDVGCGKGRALLDMCAYGFTNLAGINPFLEAAFFYDKR